ncbi:hypothetical protein J6590_070586 [Homalodisca vitripennis]|nr:hypothetical protein J6590_070586 [Homalodisca vitripennis]
MTATEAYNVIQNSSRRAIHTSCDGQHSRIGSSKLVLIPVSREIAYLDKIASKVSCGVWIEVENNEEVTVEIKAQLWFTRNILSGPLENGVDQTFSPRVREPHRYDVMAHVLINIISLSVLMCDTSWQKDPRKLNVVTKIPFDPGEDSTDFGSKGHLKSEFSLCQNVKGY